MIYDLLNKNFGLDIAKIIGIETVAVALTVFLLTLLSTRLILPVLISKKMNQPINMYIPEHANKSGTPTMGGICFIIASLVAMLAWFVLEKCAVLGENDSRRL